MALRFISKSSLEYLRTLVVVIKVSKTGVFVPEGSTSWSDNLSPDLGGREKSGGATEGATERVIKGRS